MVAHVQHCLVHYSREKKTVQTKAWCVYSFKGQVTLWEQLVYSVRQCDICVALPTLSHSVKMNSLEKRSFRTATPIGNFCTDVSPTLYHTGEAILAALVHHLSIVTTCVLSPVPQKPDMPCIAEQLVRLAVNI